MLIKALQALFGLLDAESVKDFIDAGLDKLEDKYIEGEVDTAKEVAIKGGINFLRSILGIKDEDYGSDKE